VYAQNVDRFSAREHGSTTGPRHSRPEASGFLSPGVTKIREAAAAPARAGRRGTAAAGHVGCTGAPAMTSTPTRKHRHWPLVLLPALALAAGCPASNDEPLSLDEGMADAAPTPPGRDASPTEVADVQPAPDAAPTDAAPGTSDGAPADSALTGPADAAPMAGAAAIHLKVLTDARDDVKLVAFQDGASAWRALTGAAGSYATETTTGRFGIALVCTYRTPQVGSIPPQTRSYRVLYQALASEVTNFTYDCRMADGPAPTLSGSLAGLGAGNGGRVDVTNHAAALDATDPRFTFNLPSGTYDVLASRRTQQDDVSAFVFRKDLRLEGPLHLDLDLVAEGRPAVAVPFTVAGTTAKESNDLRVSELASKAGTYCHLGDCTGGTCASLPTQELRPEDMIHFMVEVEEGAPQVSHRTARLYQRSNAPVALTLPAPFAPPAVTRDATGVTLAFADRPGAQAYRAELGGWVVVLGTGWVGPGASHQYRTPKLSALPGWNPEWGFEASDSWELGTVESNRPPARLFNDLSLYTRQGTADLDGARLTTASRRGTF
jgi:hypothetical protein